MNERTGQPKVKSTSPRIMGAALLLLTPLATGCDWIVEKLTQKAAEAAVEHVIEKESGGDVKIDASKGSVSFKSDKGNLEINSGGAKLPDNWPADVPVYPDSKIGMAIGAETHKQVFLETSDGREKVLLFYKSKLSSLKQEVSADVGEAHMLSYKDEASGRKVQLTIGAKKDGNKPTTTIILIVSDPKKAK